MNNLLEFILEHKKIVGLTAGVVVIFAVAILLVGSRGGSPSPTTNQPTATPPVNTSTSGIEPAYTFLQKNLAQEEEYLMLTAKIVTQEYGTYSSNDVRTLIDLQNQSTPAYKAKIQTLIDQTTSLGSAEFSVSTTVDADSIKLVNKTSSTAAAQMNAEFVDQNQVQKSIISTVIFVYQNGHWLVSSINFADFK